MKIKFSLLMVFVVLSGLYFSCENPTVDQQNRAVQMGWLPHSYEPTKKELVVKMDSAVKLLTQLKYDTNLDYKGFVETQEKAREILESVIREDPKYSLPYGNLAALYLDRRDTIKSLQMMSLRVQVEPDLAEGWQIMGYYKDLMGDSVGAYKDYKVALSKFEDRLALGKRYKTREDVAYYYDNWAGKAYTMLLLGQTKAGHQEVEELLDEVTPLMGKNAEAYAMLLQEDRASLLKQFKQDSTENEAQDSRRNEE